MDELDLEALEAKCRDCAAARALKEEADAAFLRMEKARPRGQHSVSPEEQAVACEAVEADYAFDHALRGLAMDERSLLALITRLRAAEARTAWQPIETAPLSEWVLVTWRGGVFVVKRTRQGWEDSRKGLYGAQPPEPTHWMPLPAPPASEVPRG